MRKNQGLSIKKGEYLSPRISSEIMDCSMPMSFDSYSYCSLNCQYCFSFFFKSNNPAIKTVELKAVNADKLIAALSGHPKDSRGKMFYEMFYSRKFLFHWGGLADPFCNFEKKNGVGYRVMEALGELNYPSLLSFKGDAVLQTKYLSLFEKYAPQHNFAFQISMVTANDEMGRKAEIGVPLPSKRLEAMKVLSDLGYWTILRLRPFIVGITDESLDELLEKALAAGMKAISTEFYALDCRANEEAKSRYKWLSKLTGTGDIEKYYAELSPSERGGYRRLNRLVKERFIKKMYKFCVEHDIVFACSDPDYKELNMSGSCCGMPDVYEPNHDLENWTRHQLTYVLKEMRKAYHRTGELQTIHFKGVFRDEPYLYRKDDLIGDHVCIINMSQADRSQATYEKVLLAQWNNLRSPASPVNYLHAKLLPVGLDEEGNMMYRYNPMSYEKRWVDEGIDLTR